MAKPPVTPETKLPPLEPDPVALQGDAPGAQAAFAAEGETTNTGYDVPASPAIAEPPKRVLAGADARVHPPMADQPQQPARPSPLEGVQSVQRRYANEVYQAELVDDTENVMDLMQSNVVALQMVVPQDPGWFREFAAGAQIDLGTRPVYRNGELVGEERIFKSEGQIDYEAFMNEGVVIRVHSTKDRNEPWVVFVGVNGDSRWLPRNKNIRLQRKFVERLAAAQEMAFRSVEDKDPSLDEAMKQVRSNAAAHEFSVIHDPNPLGRRWLHRVTRQST